MYNEFPSILLVDCFLIFLNVVFFIDLLSYLTSLFLLSFNKFLVITKLYYQSWMPFVSLLTFLTEIPNFLNDFHNVLTDFLNFLTDFPIFLTDFPNFLTEIPNLKTDFSNFLTFLPNIRTDSFNS